LFNYASLSKIETKLLYNKILMQNYKPINSNTEISDELMNSQFNTKYLK